MNHPDVAKRLREYLDGELPMSQRALVDAHLDRCQDCSGELRELRQTIHLLRSMPSPLPPASLRVNVMNRIEAGEAQPGWLERLWPAAGSWSWGGLGVPMAAAAMGAVALAVVLTDAAPPVVDAPQVASRSQQEPAERLEPGHGFDMAPDTLAGVLRQGGTTLRGHAGASAGSGTATDPVPQLEAASLGSGSGASDPRGRVISVAPPAWIERALNQAQSDNGAQKLVDDLLDMDSGERIVRLESLARSAEERELALPKLAASLRAAPDVGAWANRFESAQARTPPTP